MYPCYECGDQGFNPYLGHNGRCYHLNEKMILDIFYDRTEGPTWNGGTGWGVANVEVCDYQGVMCSKAGHVVSLTLPNMNLRGVIPDEIGYLLHLQHINLSDNYLTGFLPSDLRWNPLETIDVSGNQLKGFIPPMLCLTGDINNNGNNGDYNCNKIACSIDSWSEIGRATAEGIYEAGTNERYECIPCPGGAPFLGSKTCALSLLSVSAASSFLSQPVTVNQGAIFGGVMAGLVLFFASVFMFVHKRGMHDSDSYDDEEYSHDEIDFSNQENDASDHGLRYSDDTNGNLEASRLVGNNEEQVGFISSSHESVDDGNMLHGSITDVKQADDRHPQQSGGALPSSLFAATMAAAARQVEDAEEESKDLDTREELWLDVPKIT